MNFLYNELTKITGVLTSLILLIQHGEDVVEKVKGWAGLKRYIERQLADRRHTMFNPLTALVILGEIEKALPLVQKGLTDVNQAVADQKNPTAEFADIAIVLSDLQSLISAFGIRPATPTPMVVPPPPPATA